MSNGAQTGADPEKANDYHKGYQEYNKSLRAWFIAFGVGGAVLLLTKGNVLDRLTQAGTLYLVSGLFLVGSATQALIAFVNKVECWYCYYGFVNPNYRFSRRGQFMLWLDDQFWMDVICDLVTMTCFAAAVALIFAAYL